MLKMEFINNTNYQTKEWEELANNVLENGYKLLNFKYNIDLSIHFITSEESVKMNNDYRQKEYVADVLSFPIFMNENEIEVLNFREIGDIFICIDEAKLKSVKYEHTLKEEMAFLFVHGFLHLLGYDHETNEEDEKNMFKLQDDILKLSKINYVIKY